MDGDTPIKKEVPDEVNVFSVDSGELRRSNCVVCGSSNFENVNTVKHMPIMSISNTNVKCSYYDHQIDICKQCSCFQLRNLVKPDELYSSVYMNALFSPSWKDHNESFCSFVLNNTDDTNLMEIGANSGALYSLIKQKRDIKYSVLDMFRHKDLPEEIDFYSGNCESFNFEDHNTVILSHVFEHLYNPYEFISRLKKANVSTVFISVPNFNRLLDDKDITIIYSQHTYYCGKDHIDYLFSRFGYVCDTTIEYNGNCKSIMLKYVLRNSPPLPLPTLCKSRILDLYINKVNVLKNLIIPEKTYIMPSGIYGQFLYYLLSDKTNILGFLDNNPSRHSQTLFGTDKYVYMPSKIDISNTNVLVCNCPYKQEIIDGLHKYNINIITI